MATSAEQKQQYRPIEMQSREEQRLSAVIDDEKLEDDFDGDFFVEVRATFNKEKGISWSMAMDKVRVARLVRNYKNTVKDLEDEAMKRKHDPLLILIKQWPKSNKYKGKAKLVEPLIDRFAEILLEDKEDMNKDNRYETFRDYSNPLGMTLLHYAAEQNFFHLARTLIKYCPGLLALKTEAIVSTTPPKRGLLPVEIALEKEKDEVASVILSNMYNERVQSLFSWRPDPGLKSPKDAYKSFHNIIANPKMKKSTLAILNHMVNPRWPYLPQKKEKYSSKEEEETIEGTWATVPEDPLDYDFFYHVLDADDAGRPPKIKDRETNELVPNPFFNKNAPSCLNIIANSDHIDAVQHPVVRMLIRLKWEAFGKILLRVRCTLFVFFLLVLSYALFHASTRTNPNQYSYAGDKVRLIAEIALLVILCFHIFEEVIQIAREKKMYLKNKYNVLDWLGMLLLLAVIPLRAKGHDAQWYVSSLAYLINFLRIFKFSCVYKTGNLYMNTLCRIIADDIPKFLCVFGFIFLSFCGALFLSLRVADNQKLLGGFEQVLLSGVRVLAEGQPVFEDYNEYNPLSILLHLAYMVAVTVIMLNILIAQLSETYSQAKKSAEQQYDIDRMLLLAQSENIPLLNLRVKYYKEGDWHSELNLAEELLEFTEERSLFETNEEKLVQLRGMMRKTIKTMRHVASKNN